MSFAASRTDLPVSVPLAREPLGIWRSFREARHNIISIIPELSTHEPIVSGRTGKRWHMITDPDAIRAVVLERVDQYPKSVVTKNLLKPAIGDSLFIAEGPQWRWQRRTAAPVFSRRNVMNLAPIMSKAAERACTRISAAGTGRAVNLFEEMITTTFDVIGDVTFSGDGAFDRDIVHQAIDSYINDAGKVSLFDIIGLPEWVPRPGRMFSDSEMIDMKAMADAAIEARAKRPSDGVPDLLDLLLAGEDPETKRKMTTAELRDNLLAFIVAGHETTALALSWALYLCAFDPNVQDRGRSEAQSVLSNGRVATGEDIASLPYVRQIVDEALRLYPPAAMVSRTAQAEDTLCGTRIMPGDTVILPIYALHRSKRLWDEPDAFRPERFENRKDIKRYSYMPFGDGPRICIGASFALQEAVIILATLLSRFRFSPVQGRDPKPVMILTLRPEGGVWLMAEPV